MARGATRAPRGILLRGLVGRIGGCMGRRASIREERGASENRRGHVQIAHTTAARCMHVSDRARVLLMMFTCLCVRPSIERRMHQSGFSCVWIWMRAPCGRRARLPIVRGAAAARGRGRHGCTPGRVTGSCASTPRTLITRSPDHVVHVATSPLQHQRRRSHPHQPPLHLCRLSALRASAPAAAGRGAGRGS